MKNSFDELKSLNFSSDQIVNIVSHGGGAKNLKFLCENFTQLEQNGISKESIITYLNHNSGHLKLSNLLHKKHNMYTQSSSGIVISQSSNTNTLFSHERDSVDDATIETKSEVPTDPMQGYACMVKRKREGDHDNDAAKRLRLTL